MTLDGIILFNEFVALHKPQLESSGVPNHLWHSLYRKLVGEIFDAGEAFQLLLIDYDDDDAGEEKEKRPCFALCVTRENGIKARDANSIFLVDHAWTFRINEPRRQLEQQPQLTDRLCAITGIGLEDTQRIDKLLQSMWRYCHAYSVSIEGLTAEDRVPIWYIMDEVGSAVNHADEPNFRLVPFLYLNTQCTYSLLFPVCDCEQGEQVTRDFAEPVAKDAPERAALLLPWRFTDLQAESFVQEEPDDSYFASGHLAESYPQAAEALRVPQLNRNETLKVYAEYDIVRQHLTAADFQIVEEESEADVLWLTHHFKQFAELAEATPNKFINQFPFEYIITIKDLLSITCRRAAKEHHNPNTLETYPSWLPTTFNLKTELLQFASYYQQRAARQLDNHWIIKPWNLARGLDTHITDNIAQIMRLPSTGPKIAQKYIERPVLFQRADFDAKVKFDVRYIILLKSTHPLEAYVHRKFFVRFANRPFSLDHFDDYEKHFTVMNYQADAELHHIKCDDFLQMWKQQYPIHAWSHIEDTICNMLHEMLICATKCQPPSSMPPCGQSRALYAADIMLEWRDHSNGYGPMQPKLLEVNWTPDCKRACDYYPDFFNDIFKLLFLNEPNELSFRLLQAHSESLS